VEFLAHANTERVRLTYSAGRNRDAESVEYLSTPEYSDNSDPIPGGLRCIREVGSLVIPIPTELTTTGVTMAFVRRNSRVNAASGYTGIHESQSEDARIEAIMPSPHPTKRRKVSTACEPCRARKARCDGKRPICGACSHRSQGQGHCLYRRDEKGDKVRKRLDGLFHSSPQSP